MTEEKKEVSLEQINEAIRKLREEGINCRIKDDRVICEVEEVSIPLEEFDPDKIRDKILEKVV